MILIGFHLKYSSVNQIHEHEKRGCVKAQLLLSEIWRTVVSLTILLITIYLFLLDLKTSTTHRGKETQFFSFELILEHHSS